MFRTIAAAAFLAAAASAAQAQVNLSAEASSPGNSPHLSIIHLAEIAGEASIASL